MARSWDKNRRTLEEKEILDELKTLREAADESARHVRQLYFTFLLFAFYVAVIVFSTTHEQLLKESSARLPLLNVELPLVGFFIFVPWLVWVFHAHLLNQFYLLSGKLFELDQVLGSLPPKSERTQRTQRTQRKLPFPLIFSYLIVGKQHPGPIRWVFRTAVVVILLLVPILLLLGIQWRFLPYHDEGITGNHQLVLTLDLVLLWIFWPLLFSPSGRWRVRRPWRLGGVLALTLLLLFGSWMLLVPPGGGIERLVEYQEWLDGIQRNLVLQERTLMRRDPPVELLFAQHVKTDKERAEIWQEAGEALELRGRDLRYADFYKSNLWDADLRGAQLRGADLSEARLLGADLRRAVVYGTGFQAAELTLADLRELHSSSDGLKGLSSEIEALKKMLKEIRGRWSQDRRDRVGRAIARFRSIASDSSLEPTVFSPRQRKSYVMHDQGGLFKDWPAPPDAAEFEPARADYRAGLACNDRYIAEGMQRQIGLERIGRDDPALAEALRARAESGNCPLLAEVLESAANRRE